jgi:hypothetical protein
LAWREGGNVEGRVQNETGGARAARGAARIITQLALARVAE